MPHETLIIATIAASLVLALVFGFVATRLRLPPLVGYLVAGVVVGPFTPGFVASASLASQLAEVGVILLMFGVGLHFSFPQLMSVRRIAVPGALVQVAVATVLGATVARLWGWPWGASLVFGLALSAASTVVLVKALEERQLLDTANGRIAMGWLIVEDLVMVLALVLLAALAVPLGGTAPAAAAGAVAQSIPLALTITLAKAAAFVLLMLFVGVRAVPWLLDRVARTGSRELFTLAVLAVALGVAVAAAALFGVSLALGAFFAGVVISESDLSHQAAADALPLRDAFSVLFFVSVGMLFDPTVLVRQPDRVLATLLIIMLGNAGASFGIALFLRQQLHTALLLAASLSQVGEFSFILAALGVGLGILPEEGRSLILAGALISITLNSLVFGVLTRGERWLLGRPGLLRALERAPAGGPGAPPRSTGHGMHGHVVVVGHGRVGGAISEALRDHLIPFVVVEQSRVEVEAIRKRGVQAVFGDASRLGVLRHAEVGEARLLVVTVPDAYHARRVIELARGLNPGIDTVVRTHSEAAQAMFQKLQVGRAVMGERELALGMARYALQAMQAGPARG